MSRAMQQKNAPDRADDVFSSKYDPPKAGEQQNAVQHALKLSSTASPSSPDVERHTPPVDANEGLIPDMSTTGQHASDVAKLALSTTGSTGTHADDDALGAAHYRIVYEEFLYPELALVQSAAQVDADVSPPRDNAAELAAMDAWIAGGCRASQRKGANARKRSADAEEDGSGLELAAKRPRVQPDTAAGAPTRPVAGASTRAALQKVTNYTAIAADNEYAGETSTQAPSDDDTDEEDDSWRGTLQYGPRTAP